MIIKFDNLQKMQYIAYYEDKKRKCFICNAAAIRTLWAFVCLYEPTSDCGRRIL